MVNANKFLYLIFAGIGFIFLRSGYGKLEGGKFVSTLSGTLGKFAGENPNPAFKSFLEQIAIPNSVIFGNLTMWGEVLVGLTLILSSFYLFFNGKKNRITYCLLSIGLIFGILLNITFYFSAGWTSASTESLNLLMMMIQIAGLIYSAQQYLGKIGSKGHYE